MKVLVFETQEDSHVKTPPELTLAGWPLPDALAQMRDSLIDEGKWDVNPLALYDESDEEKHVILPQHYDSKL